MDLVRCTSDEEYAAWRTVRACVVPHDRAPSVTELRAGDSPTRLLLLARVGGSVVGCGLADRSDSGTAGFVMPRVLPEHRRTGVGSALLAALASTAKGSVTRPSAAEPRTRGRKHSESDSDSPRPTAKSSRFGRSPAPRPQSALPAGLRIVRLEDQPHLRDECFEGFGREMLADFGTVEPLAITAEAWAVDWRGEHVLLALDKHDAVVGCAGLSVDPDDPARAENSSTAVRRTWRGTGLAERLKRQVLADAGARGITELYTWTQSGNAAMRRLNERLGNRTSRQSVTVVRRLAQSGSRPTDTAS